ncbi:DUF3857 domain-containing protein [Aquimarina sp. 2-A2]|uniref:DUF3857 domain-containing protein n=1 Tax=Aquimarina sp. 2-A2 TaxID=3382644 RepID=UPI00387EED8B
MNVILKPVFLFLFLVSLQVFSQEYKFGKVSKEELSATTYLKDTTANAVILHNSKKVYYIFDKNNGFQLVTEVYQRIKLYNKKGYDYATHKFYLYKQNSGKEKVSGLKGGTYSLVNGKIVVDKLDKADIFHKEFTKNYEESTFTMPALKEGSVIEFKYKIVSPFVFNIDRVKLQYTIPVKHSVVHISIPEYFYFKKFTLGYLPINLVESSVNGKISLTSIGRSGGAGWTPVRSYTSRGTLDYKKNVYTIESKNVPAFSKEPFSGNIENYLSAVVFELAYTKFPNSSIENYSSTWENVVSTIYNSANFGGELAKKNYFKEELAVLVQGETNAQSKTMKIFNFVKNKLTWNNEYAVGTSKGVKRAFKENSGNVAEINLMLTSMLKEAGIDADPVIVSTGDRIVSLFPTVSGFNYVITRVNLSGVILYLDATDKFGVPNILPNRVIQGTARVIKKNGLSQRLNLRPAKPSNFRVSVQSRITDDGTMSGKVNVDFLDYNAHTFRVENGINSENENNRRLRENYGFSKIDNYEISGVDDLSKGVRERFTFENVEGFVEKIDDEIYFSPLLFLGAKENIFKLDKREYPVDYGYGVSDSFMVNIKIPANYSVIELPKPTGFKLPEGIGNFSYRIQENNGVIQLIVQSSINYSLIPAEYYAALKEFYNMMLEKQSEQVVLKKI